MDALYVATATASGGRVGRAVASDGNLAVDLVVPPEMGGSGEPGTNPEQLFAAGYSACFLSALTLVSGKRGVDASLATVTANVGLLRAGRDFKLEAELNVVMPGVEADRARELVDLAHQACPYSNATRGNIDVRVELQQPAAASGS